MRVLGLFLGCLDSGDGVFFRQTWEDKDDGYMHC